MEGKIKCENSGGKSSKRTYVENQMSRRENLAGKM